MQWSISRKEPSFFRIIFSRDVSHILTHNISMVIWRPESIFSDHPSGWENCEIEDSSSFQLYEYLLYITLAHQSSKWLQWRYWDQDGRRSLYSSHWTSLSCIWTDSSFHAKQPRQMVIPFFQQHRISLNICWLTVIDFMRLFCLPDVLFLCFHRKRWESKSLLG